MQSCEGTTSTRALCEKPSVLGATHTHTRTHTQTHTLLLCTVQGSLHVAIRYNDGVLFLQNNGSLTYVPPHSLLICLWALPLWLVFVNGTLWLCAFVLEVVRATQFVVHATLLLFSRFCSPMSSFLPLCHHHPDHCHHCVWSACCSGLWVPTLRISRSSLRRRAFASDAC